MVLGCKKESLIFGHSALLGKQLGAASRKGNLGMPKAGTGWLDRLKSPKNRRFSRSVNLFCRETTREHHRSVASKCPPDLLRLQFWRLPPLLELLGLLVRSHCSAIKMRSEGPFVLKASMRVCLIASRPAINRTFVQHPPRTKKIITRRIDHALANHDRLRRSILQGCSRPFFPNTLGCMPICYAAMRTTGTCFFRSVRGNQLAMRF
jgi:hypothetical protein